MGEILNWERCRKAMQDITVTGEPLGNIRLKAIEDAISEIIKNGNKALLEEYIGVKNYAGFGDQRKDHKYGYGPRHGHIVFSIKRLREKNVELGVDHIYFLECVRDAGRADPELFNDTYQHNLVDVIREYDQAMKKAKKLSEWVSTLKVESHKKNDLS